MEGAFRVLPLLHPRCSEGVRQAALAVNLPQTKRRHHIIYNLYFSCAVLTLSLLWGSCFKIYSEVAGPYPQRKSGVHGRALMIRLNRLPAANYTAAIQRKTLPPSGLGCPSPRSGRPLEHGTHSKWLSRIGYCFVLKIRALTCGRAPRPYITFLIL